jgi:hypothetical protein
MKLKAGDGDGDWPGEDGDDERCARVALRLRRLSARALLLTFKHRLFVLLVALLGTHPLQPLYNSFLTPQPAIQGAGQARRLRYSFDRAWPLLSC